MQPHATIWENNWPVSGRVQNVAETVLDQVQALPVKKEMKARSSNLEEADSTSNKDQLTSQLLLHWIPVQVKTINQEILAWKKAASLSRQEA